MPTVPGGVFSSGGFRERGFPLNTSLIIVRDLG